MSMTTFVRQRSVKGRPNNGSWIKVNEDKYIVGMGKKHATRLWVVKLSRGKETIGVASFDC